MDLIVDQNLKYRRTTELINKPLKEFNFNETDVTFTDDAIKYNKYHCKDEKGVRNLKRNIEIIIIFF